MRATFTITRIALTVALIVAATPAAPQTARTS
jgi:hypothetical protein